MKRFYLIIQILFVQFLVTQLHAQQIAFPGAEGAGKFTSGGRGTVSKMTTVFEVTNLTDVNSVGSLRYACSQSSSTYPYRTIVFRVSGTIHLTSRLNIPANTTVAGQTAPGDGICLADYPVVINGDNVILRYIRCRMGDKNQLKTSPFGCGIPVAPFTAACMPLDGSGGDDALGNLGNKNIIIDHCSISWSNDEALTVYRGDSVTIQWNIISEPLNYSYHFETGDADFEHHGYGGIWGSLHGSFHHNLLAHCRNRNPRFAGNSTYATGSIESADFRNNVIYNWGINTVYGGEGGNYNIVNNYYKYGPSTSVGSVQYRIVGVDSNATDGYAKYYLSGNYVDGSTANTNNNWLGAYMNTGNAADTVKSKVTTPFLSAYLPSVSHTALQAYDSVLKNAGCILPIRDTLDQRVINNVKNRTGALIDCQGGYPHATPYASTVNAWPTLNNGTAPTDTDHDGMPDDWENANGLNLNDATDRGVFAANGYTNLENYLNSISANTGVATSTSPASATWTLLSNQTASVVGNISANDQSIGSFLTGIVYGSTFGGISGWQRVGSTSGLPIGYDANSYTEYKVTPTNGKYFTATLIELGALGGGTGTAKMAVYYSLDNFATSNPVGNCTYNGTNYDATVAGTPVSLLNTSTTTLTGQQIASLPTFITVAPTQTLTVRVYAWITGTGTRYFPSQNVKIEGVTSDISLPATIINFKANWKSNYTELTWQTVNEINLESYTVEKSEGGVVFDKVGSIQSKNGTSNSYAFIDYDAQNGIRYYRIKGINRDGSSFYSKIITINKLKKDNEISIYPNPVKSVINVHYKFSNKNLNAYIYGVDGKKVGMIVLSANSTNTSFDVGYLSKGMYYININFDNSSQVVKFLKQ